MLVGFQGALGWYMVQSGLVNRTDVSHFRLSAHLLTALLLLAGLVWTALDLRQLARNGDDRPARLTALGAGVTLLLVIQLLLGAWVAGLDAGQVANSWPLMNDRFVPEGIDTSRGAWFAFSHDPYLIHFLHRWWAWVVVVGMVVLARRVRPLERRASIAIHSALGTQILLGIATVISGVALPLAVLHQAVGALLVAATAWGAHVIGRRAQ
jgi:cytochrome c oxidase assembly protein subunit 15